MLTVAEHPLLHLSRRVVVVVVEPALADGDALGVLAELAQRLHEALLGLLGLVAFFWASREGQWEDLEGAGHRVLLDRDPED